MWCGTEAHQTELASHFGDRRPVGWVLGEQPIHDSREYVRYLRRSLVERLRCLELMCDEHLGLWAGEHRHAREEIVEDASERIEIGGRCDGAGARLLRRHECRSPYDGARARVALHFLDHAEVDDLQPTVSR